MERLEGPLADLVAAERKEMDATPKSRDAAWAGIAASWQPTPPMPPAVASVPAAASSGAGALKVVGALVVATSVAAGGWALRDDEPQAPIERVEAPADADVVDDVQKYTSPPPSLPLVADPPPAPKVAEVETRRVREPRPAPADRTPGLADELALIDAMRKDVAAGRFAKALERAKQHRDDFGKGSLTADRVDLEAAARCGLGDLDAGRALAERKKTRWPRAPMSPRLRTLCELER